MNPQASLFLPHGAPTFALEPGPAGAALANLAASMPRPSAILIVSAHWNTPTPTIGSALQPDTIHDYYGFPQALYSLSYPAKGDAALSDKVMKMLEEAGIQARFDANRGLDHGAWIPLLIMYPEAEIPVLQLSIQYGKGPAHHYELGRALSRLPEQGVLIATSGNLTHNLYHYRPGSTLIPSYVQEFSDWIGERLAQCDIDSLLNYRALAPGAREAHPTDEHLLPLFVAIGAMNGRFDTEFIYRGVYEGIIAMDAFAFRRKD
ncbi:MAG: dioxygenase [Burkholderiales bacterium]|nr:dioxygenase [Burkholderiales bacterium]